MDKLLVDVMNGKFMTVWQDEGYSYFFNVVLTGEEKYGDYSLVMTKKPHSGQRYGGLREVTKELVGDPNFMTYAKSITEHLKSPA